MIDKVQCRHNWVVLCCHVVFVHFPTVQGVGVRDGWVGTRMLGMRFPGNMVVLMQIGLEGGGANQFDEGGLARLFHQ